MRYSLVIFDLDGTILNTIDDLTDASNFINSKYGFSVHTADQFKFFVGNGIPKMIERSIPPETPRNTYEKILAEYIDYYENHCAIKTKPYEGIIDCIKQLRTSKIKIAVNTNKIQSAAEELCNKYFPECFDIISGSRPGIPPKPAPDGIYEILKSAGISSGETKQDNTGKTAVCYVGDSDVDFLTAKNSGLDFIGCDWGFRGRDFLLELGVKKIAMSPMELIKEII